MTHPREGKGYVKRPGTKGYRSRTDDEQRTLHIRLPDDLRNRLFIEAERRVVSVNFLVEKALESTLKTWEKQKLS